MKVVTGTDVVSILTLVLSWGKGETVRNFSATTIHEKINPQRILRTKDILLSSVRGEKTVDTRL